MVLDGRKTSQRPSGYKKLISTEFRATVSPFAGVVVGGPCRVVGIEKLSTDRLLITVSYGP
jgi:hypothetical protein